MLISFAVENYRSFRERQTMSLLAEDGGKLEFTTACTAPALQGRRVLGVVAIYGANASGKSNFVKAFNSLARIVALSAKETTVGEPLPIEPFGLDASCEAKPTSFSITFVIKNVVYVYDVALSRQRVYKEELTAYPKTHPQRLFSRNVDKAGKSTWHFSRTHFRRDSALEDRTRPNSLYLSVGALFNHPVLTSISNFFLRSDTREPRHAAPELALTIERLSEDKSFMKWASKVLSTADTGIMALRPRITDRTGEMPAELREHLPKEIALNLRRQPDAQVEHRSASGESIWWTIGRESDGTKQLFSLLRSWYDILYSGGLVFVDELNDSLHPLISRRLLQILATEKPPKTRGQLVFTTHDTTLLDPALLRRDQIFLTEKTREGATSLYSLLDYAPRPDEALAKGYLAGRYGAIPYLGEFRF